MNRPIPRKLLPHEATVLVPATKDRWGNVTDPTTVTLKRIRVDPTNKMVQSPTNQEVKLNAILFFDVKNSYATNAGGDRVTFNFEEDQRITFNGKERRVEIIDALNGRNKLHHYEVGLV